MEVPTVVYVLNDDPVYWALMRNSALSVAAHWPAWAPLVVVVATDGPALGREAEMTRAALDGKADLRFEDISSWIDEFGLRKDCRLFSYIVKARFVLSFALGDRFRRALLLDADTEAVGPLDGLVALDTEGRSIAGFADAGFRFDRTATTEEVGRDRSLSVRADITDELDRLDVVRVAGPDALDPRKNDPYVNAGVLLFDFSRMPADRETARVRLANRLVDKYGLLWADQDAFNLLWDIRRLGCDEFNVMPFGGNVPENAKLLHITGGVQPLRLQLNARALARNAEWHRAPAPRPRKDRLFVSVYAITKNEEKFVDRWMDSMSEADEVVVLDTGSTDGTVAKLRARGALVKTRVFRPWRFDTSRNESMRLCSPEADILVCTDLDEVLNKGWRKQLENAWTAAVERGERPTTATYRYIWSFTADGDPDRTFTYEKVHAPGVCHWTHPVHEVLAYDGPKICVRVPGMLLEHHPDKTKSRASYLPLLEMSVREDPEDDRNMHYLGREYMFHGEWQKAIDTLQRHLGLPRAKWRAERAASMRFIARCHRNLGNDLTAELWYYRAMDEAPDQRESAVEFAQWLYDRKAPWSQLEAACRRALSVKDRLGSYLTEADAWGEKPHDLLSVALWNLGDRAGALAEARRAFDLSPNDERIRRNVEIMEAK